MISKGAVSLKAARQDCGLSSGGGLRGVQEFQERTFLSNPSLAQLKGTCIGHSKKSEYGQYRNNYNRGSACRPNYGEINAFSLDPDFMSNMFQSFGDQMSTCYGYYDTHDVMAGYSYCGQTPPGRMNLRYHWTSERPWNGTTQLEVIGWTSGYFAGSPHYYVGSYLSDDYNSGPSEAIDVLSGYPYTTIIVQSFSPAGITDPQTRLYQVRGYYQ